MNAKEPDQPPAGTEAPLDPAVTPDLFLKWRAPRFGQTNPERMNNPIWEWLVKSKLNAYTASQRLDGPSAMDAGPGWCFDRFGQSSTRLPDGRVVFIAGEHEDHYDPDFYIYNDVVILHSKGKVDILGYPREAFPPTDFHTATLAGNHIIIIGCLGYPKERKPGVTPVFVLDLKTFTISPMQTFGTSPGWLHGHEATLIDGGNSILIRYGKLDRGGEDASLVENIDDWKLYLADWHWERLTERRWKRWEIIRKDRKPNHLWHIRQAIWSQSVGWEKELREQMEQLTEDLGVRPDLDLMARLFNPSISHEEMPKVEDEYNIYRIKVNSVVVRYVEDMHSIQMTVEGDLPQATIGTLVSELTNRLSILENTTFDLREV